ncbi:EVE domain-containing protein [Dyadobacter luticola]|uniref:EVE domain-containing protein n=1 Tax=Dyadobacter luticola TaxID=1979387 RepID=A0A5R9KWE5_9BACT|nr:EVE domain-containing protein [Dyadobacter luticola]TLV00407.1 EVE domain-containing protein [Dyadobacter luticola]
MAYYITLFSPDTYNAFTQTERSISGFRENQKTQANAIKKGDKLIAYVTKLSRWAGILEVTGEYFIDNSPVYSEDDVYTLRFPVKEIAWLPLDQALPVDDEECWTSLSFTKNLPRKSTAWTNMVRGNVIANWRENKA